MATVSPQENLEYDSVVSFKEKSSSTESTKSQAPIAPHGSIQEARVSAVAQDTLSHQVLGEHTLEVEVSLAPTDLFEAQQISALEAAQRGDSIALSKILSNCTPKNCLAILLQQQDTMLNVLEQLPKFQTAVQFTKAVKSLLPNPMAVSPKVFDEKQNELLQAFEIYDQLQSGKSCSQKAFEQLLSINFPDAMVGKIVNLIKEKNNYSTQSWMPMLVNTIPQNTTTLSIGAIRGYLRQVVGVEEQAKNLDSLSKSEKGALLLMMSSACGLSAQDLEVQNWLVEILKKSDPKDPGIMGAIKFLPDAARNKFINP